MQSQYYVGCKHERVRGDAYYELLDEFITAAQRRCAGSMPQYKYNAQSCSIILVIRAYVSLRNLSIHKPVICPTCCRFGNTVIVHFEDMAHANLDRLLSQYRGTLPCFSDDVQVRLNRSLPTLVACLTLHGFFLHGICRCL